MYRLLSIILIFVFPSLGLAQEMKHYAFKHYGTTDGLSSNESISVTQDKNGYIWIGGTYGIQRFDGSRFRSFRHRADDLETIPNNYVQQILMDIKGNLWVLTGDGKCGIFDTRTFKYKPVSIKIDDEIKLRSGRNLYTDEKGNVMLLLHYQEVLTYHPGKNELSSEHNFIPLPKNWHVNDIIHQPGTDKYIISTSDSLLIYDRATKKFSELISGVQNVAHMMYDRQGRLWFDTWSGGMPAISLYDFKSKKFILNEHRLLPQLKVYHETHGKIQQRNGDIWIHGLGVFGKYNEKGNYFDLVYNGWKGEQSIAYTKVSDLFEDKEENIWVATSNNGLYRFNPASQFFTNITHVNRVSGNPGEGSILSFLHTKKGTLLTGAWGDGLYHYSSDLKDIRHGIKGLDEKVGFFPWSMNLSHNGNTIWAGAQPGIYAVEQSTSTFKYYNPPIMQSRTVRQVLEDREGNLWIGTQSLGVFKWKNARTKRSPEDISSFKEIPSTQILKLTLDSQGWVWVATTTSGLYVVDPVKDKVLMHFGTQESYDRRLNADGVACAIEYDDSTMVIGANGLYLYNRKQNKITSRIPLQDHIPGAISAIETDKQGYLWVSMTSGLFRVNPKNKIFVQFDRTDGIANDFFIVASSYKMPDGRLLFGANNQFIIFNPAEVTINTPAPDVHITDFRLMNKSLQVDSIQQLDKIRLGPDKNSVVIEFSGLSFKGSHIIKYKLEGLDEDWKIADESSQAIYSYLPSGNYTFQVKSENADGVEGKKITSLKISVQPHFYETWWFLGLLVLAGVGVLYFLDRLRLQKLRATESIRSRIANSLTEDMSNSLSSINISSELAKRKIETDSVRAKEYINQISETSNRMVQAMSDMVWSINPESDTMTDVIERMKIYAAECENCCNASVVFAIDKSVETMKLDMEHRYELLAIFKEAVSNATRHSGGRHVQVVLRLKNRKLIMLVEDDGKGFDVDAKQLSRGINDMRRRAAAINAAFYLESNFNTGTIVKLEMPL